MTWETLAACSEQVVFWFGTLVAAASIIVRATPTQKDDAFLAKVVKALELVSVVSAKIRENKQDQNNDAG